ncbi:MAG: metallophosphoesterase [Ruminococcus sp.]
MKYSKLKKTTAVVLSALTLTSAMALTPTTAFATQGKITYTFTGDEKAESGYAQGKIQLSSLPEGKYYLYWADDNNALQGYYEIAQVNVKGGAGSFTFGDHTAIPVDAKKLIATTSKKNTSVNNAVAVYDIPKSKQQKYTSKDANYTFMNYSDIHIDIANNQYYKYSELHWEKALETAVNKNAEFIVTAGDNITNGEGPGKEFDKYQEILGSSDFSNPVYEASGNHEIRTGERKALLSTFVTATGLDGNKETIEENKPYYSFEEPKTGDLFIVMALEYKYDPQSGDEFSKEQLDWLENLLEENYNKNKNIYLIQHALIEGYGAGDDEDNYYTVPLSPDYDSTNRFRKIIENYKDIIWISGHTHIALKYGYNYSNMNDTACHMIHDSSVCCPTTLNYSSHNLSYSAHDDEELKDMSEGYYVQVFDDRSIFYGENLYHNMIYPNACYVVEGCRSTYEEKKAENEKVVPTGKLPEVAELSAFSTQLLQMPKSFTYKNITAEDITSISNTAKDVLENFYPFSSYNSYQALKSAIKTADSKPLVQSYKDISTAYVEFLPYTYSGEMDIYFVNTKNWEKVYAHLWSAKNDNGEPGVEMTQVGTNEEGFTVYKTKVNYNMYKQVIFGDGGDTELTEEQTLSGEENQMFTANSHDPSAPYFCLTGKYGANEN